MKNQDETYAISVEGAAGEQWRIHVDMVDGSWHASNTDKGTAEAALAGYEQRASSSDDGMGFEDIATGQRWAYPWEVIREVRIMPLREAI
jgi:hypothetical protein